MTYLKWECEGRLIYQKPSNTVNIEKAAIKTLQHHPNCCADFFRYFKLRNWPDMKTTSRSLGQVWVQKYLIVRFWYGRMPYQVLLILHGYFVSIQTMGEQTHLICRRSGIQHIVYKCVNLELGVCSSIDNDEDLTHLWRRRHVKKCLFLLWNFAFFGTIQWVWRYYNLPLLNMLRIRSFPIRNTKKLAVVVHVHQKMPNLSCCLAEDGKNYNKLFCSLNLLFCSVLVAVAFCRLFFA